MWEISMICFDSDDFGANHVISDMCQSHDCRDQLDKFHRANPNFKATLFAIPAEMTLEMLEWCRSNKSWIELAVHGFDHRDNYECSEWPYAMAEHYLGVKDWDAYYWQRIVGQYFVKGFKAPGWQISDGIYRWLKDNGWWVADQAYNNERRPKDLPVYIISDNSIHTHCWNCVGNGVYELEDEILNKIKDETDFKFVSEMIYGN